MKGWRSRGWMVSIGTKEEGNEKEILESFLSINNNALTGFFKFYFLNTIL